MDVAQSWRPQESVFALLAAGALLAGASAVRAQDNSTNQTDAGAEGTVVAPVIVTAERNKAAANAPTKATLEEVQPEAIIIAEIHRASRRGNGSWVSAAGIAPSMSGTPPTAAAWARPTS